MSVDIQRLIDPEDRYLAQVPFGRNRFLRALGVALFSLATRLVTPEIAHASHNTNVYPCFGYGLCHSCNGGTCNCCGCYYPPYLDCPSGGQCWYSCHATTHQVFRCCDWNVPGDNPCLCKQYAYCCC